MNTLRVTDIPILAEWCQALAGNEAESLLTSHIDDLKECISDLQLLADNYATGDEEREMLNQSSRAMASVVHDLKTLRSEMKAALLISEAGLKPKKGGEA